MDIHDTLILDAPRLPSPPGASLHTSITGYGPIPEALYASTHPARILPAVAQKDHAHLGQHLLRVVARKSSRECSLASHGLPYAAPHEQTSMHTSTARASDSPSKLRSPRANRGDNQGGPDGPDTC